MTKFILGLDVSTIMGVSYQTKESHETFELQFKKLKGMPRVEAFSNWFLEYLEHHPIDLVVFEGYSFGSFGSSMSVLIEIGTILRLNCYLLKIPYVEISPQMLKKFVTGKGNSKKEEMMMQVLKRWGYESKTNNEADAYGLAKIGLIISKEVEPTNAHEREILTLKG